MSEISIPTIVAIGFGLIVVAMIANLVKPYNKNIEYDASCRIPDDRMAACETNAGALCTSPSWPASASCS